MAQCLLYIFQTGVPAPCFTVCVVRLDSTQAAVSFHQLHVEANMLGNVTVASNVEGLESELVTFRLQAQIPLLIYVDNAKLGEPSKLGWGWEVVLPPWQQSKVLSKCQEHLIVWILRYNWSPLFLWLSGDNFSASSSFACQHAVQQWQKVQLQDTNFNQ